MIATCRPRVVPLIAKLRPVDLCGAGPAGIRVGMAYLGDGPFTALTLVAAPAVLTNASSVLALGTSNRFARAVDRQRQLSSLLESQPDNVEAELGELRLRQLHRAERRAQLLLRALTNFYAALGSFAGASLISVMGAVLATPAHPLLSRIASPVVLAVGVLGVGGLVHGCFLLIRETRITLGSLREDAAFSRGRFESRRGQAGKIAGVAPPI